VNPYVSFLIRLEAFQARGDARVKLRQNGIVSLMIRPAVFLAGGRAYMKLHLIQCPLSCDLWLVGAAFACIPLLFKRGSRDLPGQSRLKTAPTVKNNKVSFPIRLAVFRPEAPLV
jgi:hypothetical protein